MPPRTENAQLNTFSTVVSILAVVVSIIITMGGYFATTATTVEKIARIEDIIPSLQSKIDTLAITLHKHELMLNENKANLRLLDSQRTSVEARLSDKDITLDKQIEEIKRNIDSLKDDIDRMRSAIRN